MNVFSSSLVFERISHKRISIITDGNLALSSMSTPDAALADEASGCHLLAVNGEDGTPCDATDSQCRRKAAFRLHEGVRSTKVSQGPYKPPDEHQTANAAP